MLRLPGGEGDGERTAAPDDQKRHGCIDLHANVRHERQRHDQQHGDRPLENDGPDSVHDGDGEDQQGDQHAAVEWTCRRGHARASEYTLDRGSGNHGAADQEPQAPHEFARCQAELEIEQLDGDDGKAKRDDKRGEHEHQEAQRGIESEDNAKRRR